MDGPHRPRGGARCCDGPTTSRQGREPASERLASTTRKDGTKQLTYNGQPLYLYIEDPPNTDQANGQNVDQQWFVAKP